MKHDTEQGIFYAYNKVTGVNNTDYLVEYHFLVLYHEIVGY